jgi:hypothetical protein
LAEKPPHGGDRRRQAARLGPLRRRTAQALAEAFHADAATIRRDGAFAAAVNRIAANCGADVKPWILSRGAKLTRALVLALDKLPLEEQRHVVTALKETGELPQEWCDDGEPETITLPNEPRALAPEPLSRRGRASAEEVATPVIGLDPLRTPTAAYHVGRNGLGLLCEQRVECKEVGLPVPLRLAQLQREHLS